MRVFGEFWSFGQHRALPHEDLRSVTLHTDSCLSSESVAGLMDWVFFFSPFDTLSKTQISCGGETIM